jgi:hypothetical protein
MAAHEEERQRVVALGRGIGPGLRRIAERPFLLHGECLALAPRDVAAKLIGHAPRGDMDQPCARVLRQALARPLHRGGEERFLHGILGCGEIAEPAHDDAEHLRRERAQEMLDRGSGPVRRHCSIGGALMTWRTSTGM